MEKNLKKKDKISNIKPIVITERDKAVLTKVADYRVLTTEQLYRLCFPSLSRARKRLLQLWHHSYLKRVVRPTRMGEGSSMYLYQSTRKGLLIIPHDAGLQSKASHRVRHSTLFTDHALAINDFRICLELASSRIIGLSLSSWKEGKELLMRTNLIIRGIIKPIAVIPDAYFALKYRERTFHYFLEIDRGTTSLKRIALKCRGYLNIWQEKTAHPIFDHQSFRVLFVTSSDKRLGIMIELLRKLFIGYQRIDIICITTSEEYSLAKPGKLLEPIWKTVDNKGNIRTNGLLPVTSFQSSRQREENHHCAVQHPIPVNGNPGPGG